MRKKANIRFMRRGERYRMRVYAEYSGWMLREQKVVMVRGKRCTEDEFPLISLELIPRTLFMVNGQQEFTFPVPVPLITPRGIKAKWIYLWEEAEVAGVSFMVGEEESRLITPVPMAALEEV